MMKRKIYTLIVMLVVILSATLIIVPKNQNVKADAVGENEDDYLDFQLIYNVTRDLSDFVNTSYDEENGELAKGRAFGTRGENDAADYINYTFNNLLNISAHTERLQGRTGHYAAEYEEEIDDKLEVLEKGILLNGITPIDGYISPRWNNSLRFRPNDKNILTHNFSYGDLEI